MNPSYHGLPSEVYPSKRSPDHQSAFDGGGWRRRMLSTKEGKVLGYF
jgi:hypothetical protein